MPQQPDDTLATLLNKLTALRGQHPNAIRGGITQILFDGSADEMLEFMIDMIEYEMGIAYIPQLGVH